MQLANWNIFAEEQTLWNKYHKLKLIINFIFISCKRTKGEESFIIVPILRLITEVIIMQIN